jgi:hypothetical protein
MQFPKTMTGLAAKASDAGPILIVMVHKGTRSVPNNTGKRGQCGFCNHPRRSIYFSPHA